MEGSGAGAGTGSWIREAQKHTDPTDPDPDVDPDPQHLRQLSFLNWLLLCYAAVFLASWRIRGF
jgi:hypothetical protein